MGGEEVSVQLQLVGERRPFDFPVKDHLQLGEELDLIDFETGGVVSAAGRRLPACLPACLPAFLPDACTAAAAQPSQTLSTPPVH